MERRRLRSRVTTRLTATLAALTLAAAGIVATGAPAYAATPIQVTSFDDYTLDCDSAVLTTPVTLRSAICVANQTGGEQLISLPAGSYELAPAQGPLVVGTQSGSNITIDAPNGMATIRGGGTHRVMTLDPAMVGGVTVQLRNLTISGGVDNTHGGGGIIAGSYNAATPDTLIITDSVFTNNRANTNAENTTNRPGGAIQFIGGTLSVTGSSFTQNSSGSSAGGAIAYQAVGHSGQSLTISDSVFSENSTRSVGALPNGGAAVVIDDTGNFTDLSITGSNFINNSSSSADGSDTRGAAVWLRGGNLSLTKSTFTGNSLSGGATSAGAAVHVEGDATTTASYNLFLGNAGGHAFSASSSANVRNNWWGCGSHPGATGCATAQTASAADYTPWLTLTVTADPEDIPVEVETTTVKIGR